MHHSFGRWLEGRHHCAGRGAGRPVGFFGGMLARGGRGLHGLRAGRKLGSDDLQLVILALLEEKPSHGYEVIKELEERSGGFYSPSPGMVYPALTYLEELGFAEVEAEGAKKRYRITDEGRAHLDTRRAFAEAIFAQLRWIGSRMEHVRRAFEGDGPATSEPETERPSSSSARALYEARRVIRAALASKFDADADEQRRIADILRRAADEIIGKRR